MHTLLNCLVSLRMGAGMTMRIFKRVLHHWTANFICWKVCWLRWQEVCAVKRTPQQECSKEDNPARKVRHFFGKDGNIITTHRKWVECWWEANQLGIAQCVIVLCWKRLRYQERDVLCMQQESAYGSRLFLQSAQQDVQEKNSSCHLNLWEIRASVVYCKERATKILEGHVGLHSWNRDEEWKISSSSIVVAYVTWQTDTNVSWTIESWIVMALMSG